MRKSLLALIVIALLAMVGVQSALAATTTYQLAYRGCINKNITSAVPLLFAA